MPIQFQCPSCQSVIRTPDGSEGKQARCPKCNTIATIPGTPSAAPASPAIPSDPLGGFGGGAGGAAPPNPFSTPPANQPTNMGGFGAPGGFPPPGGYPPPTGSSSPGGFPPPSGFAPPGGSYGGSPPSNPYMAPSYGGYSGGGGGGGGSQGAAKLKIPAIGLIVCASLSICYALVNAVTVAVQLSNGEMEVPPDGPERIGFIIGAILGMVGVGLIPLISLYGSVQMLRGKSYGWSIAASILGMLPCSACCLGGLVFGIWALILLNQPDVKQSFR